MKEAAFCCRCKADYAAAYLLIPLGNGVETPAKCDGCRTRRLCDKVLIGPPIRRGVRTKESPAPW